VATADVTRVDGAAVDPESLDHDARRPFAPGLPHFVPIGPNQWVETPYARARCVYDDGSLAEGDRLFCPEHRAAQRAGASELGGDGGDHEAG
jgi:hypothetical protein